jgi:hypothetical protein
LVRRAFPFAALQPGFGRSTINDADKGAQIRKDFTVGPGETVDVGDILIEKPRS